MLLMPVSLIVGVVAAVEIALGVLFYVTIRQVQIIDKAVEDIGRTQSGQSKTIVATSADIIRAEHEIEDLYGQIAKLSTRIDASYQIAAECRNELARMHMAQRKETAE